MKPRAYHVFLAYKNIAGDKTRPRLEKLPQKQFLETIVAPTPRQAIWKAARNHHMQQVTLIAEESKEI